MMTKEDYLKLPKERLAELLVEEAQKHTPCYVGVYRKCMYDGCDCTNYFGCTYCNRRPITYWHGYSDTITSQGDVSSSTITTDSNMYAYNNNDVTNK